MKLKNLRVKGPGELPSELSFTVFPNVFPDWNRGPFAINLCQVYFPSLTSLPHFGIQKLKHLKNWPGLYLWRTGTTDSSVIFSPPFLFSSSIATKCTHSFHPQLRAIRIKPKTTITERWRAQWSHQDGAGQSETTSNLAPENNSCSIYIF